MKTPPKAIIFVVTSLICISQNSNAAIAVGLTGSGLISFDTDNPGTTLGSVIFSGLGADTIVDIDYRPSDQQLYGISASGRLYTINLSTGSAAVNTSVGVGTLGTVLDGDFNPVANRLRVYSVGDANFRLTPDSSAATAVTADGTLTYAAGDENVGQSPNLRSSAYTNSIIGASSTTLFSIDSDFDTLVIHPAAGGPQFSLLSTVGLLNLNGLSLNFGNNVGFDILGSGTGNIGYISNGNSLYEVDLGTADLVPLGTIGGPDGGFSITSLALVPEPSSLLLAAFPLGLLALHRKRPSPAVSSL